MLRRPKHSMIVVVAPKEEAQRYNVLFGLSCGKVYEPFFFRRENKNINEIICHDPLELWLMPQLSEGKRNVFQHDSVPPYIYTELTRIGSRLSDVLATWGPLSGLKYYQDIA